MDELITIGTTIGLLAIPGAVGFGFIWALGRIDKTYRTRNSQQQTGSSTSPREALTREFD